MKIKHIISFLLVYICLGLTAFKKASDDEKQKGKSFSIAVIPDTQYNTKESQGGSNALFEAQTQWIIDNREKENIVYVIHLGDITDDGDSAPKQWENAVKAMYPLERPQPGLPDGIPYGMAVGNHDQYPSQFAVTGKTHHYNKYFGIDHFKGRPYYGGHYREDNDSHYDLFSAGGIAFVAIYLEFDAFDENIDALNDWAVKVLEKHADRKAIIVSHYLIGNNKVSGTNLAGEASFGKQGQRIYDRLKTKPNVFMMLCGHVGDNGEGYRQDTYAGNTIKTFLSDYQSRPMGGNGLMRLMTFQPAHDIIQVKTLSPYHKTYERDGDSEFVKPLFREAAATRIFDFNNDGTSELASFKKGTWQMGDTIINFGREEDIAVPANYYGDGKASLAVFHREEGSFEIQGKETVPIGKAGDIPVPADYNGDGITDLAVWRPSNSTWYTQNKEPLKHGWTESVPVPADYDGDGKAEPAIVRLSNYTWYISELGNVPFGQTGDIPVPADYDGDGRVDIAIYRPSTGEWLIYGKPTIKLGDQQSLPIPGDYEGTGKVQAAVFNPATKKVYTASGKELIFNASIESIVNLPYAIKLFYLAASKSAK